MSALVHCATTTAPAHALSCDPLALAPAHAPLSARCAYDARIRRPRAMTVEHPRPPYPLAATDRVFSHGHELAEDVESQANLASRRQTWIKRLSISTSHSSSRTSSPGPQSPAVSCSNGSMAFSHDGSTAPIIGNRPPSPLPPNKLVKRSSSVAVSAASPFPGSGSRLPSLRRPATSHQRSATLRHQSALMEMTAEASSTDELSVSARSDVDAQYVPFFTAKATKESKRRSAPVGGHLLRRIFPSDQHKPTLMLAKSISPDTTEIDELSSDDGDSVYFISRPGTPMSITAVIATSAEPPRGDQHEAAHATQAHDNRPRRSFSISDMLSSGGRARKQRAAKHQASKLTRKANLRVESAPVLTTAGRQRSNTTHCENVTTFVRRELTDPALVRHDIATSAGPRDGCSSQNSLGGAFLPSPFPALSPTAQTVILTQSNPVSMHQGNMKRPASATTNHVPPSPTLAQSGGQLSRHSAAPSEQASTLVGSDNETRGVVYADDSDADIQSETLYDSLRTGATRSTTGARGPRIETIFDESPPPKVKVTALRDLLPRGMFLDQSSDDTTGQHSITEEDGSISTPVRTVVPSLNGSPNLSRGHGTPLFPSLVPSPPPDMRKPLSLGTLEWDLRAEDGSSKWSVEEDEDDEGTSWADFDDLPTPHSPMPGPLGYPKTRSTPNGISTKPHVQHQFAADYTDRDTRSSIFDWSEQQHTDRSSGNRTPPRPSTVHGKKDTDRRGSRTLGRRVPSGLHARSQSVPVVPEGAGKRTTVVTNKFGTWGVGSKGVTEDWNDDFDFSEINEEPASEDTKESRRVDSGTAMVVPKTIQEQQTNVLANIGLLREWGLLIEELKEQRIRAAALGLLHGPHAGIWEEVDAMINLADQEAENDGLARLSTPSTPGFDEGAFDEVSDPFAHQLGNHRRTSGMLASEDHNKHAQPPSSPTQPNRLRRKSILPSHHDVFSSPSPHPSPKASGKPNKGVEPQVVVTRPRKDSEAKAQSIIEALQNKRMSHDHAMGLKPSAPSKKVPFDTATLRRIVPYVNTLTRKVKDCLREAEGLYASPCTSPPDPSFSKMFHSDNDMAAQMKLMTIT